jgi:hypothetical protein
MNYTHIDGIPKGKTLLQDILKQELIETKIRPCKSLASLIYSSFPKNTSKPKVWVKKPRVTKKPRVIKKPRKKYSKKKGGRV